MTAATEPGTVVVVGASCAGASAVETLRREGYDGRIVLVGEEPELPYERPPLSKGYLLGTTPEERVYLRSADFYTDLRVELRLGTRAAALDAATREVTLADGARLAYDRLLIATGSTVRRLRVPGADLAGIHYLRTLADARTFAEQAHSVGADARVVVVGAGFIGAEAAAVCRTLGLEVTLLDILPQPMERVLGAEMGAWCANVHRDHGVDLRMSEGIAAFRGTGRVEAVVTGSGAIIPCAFAIVGVGVLPADDWLAGSGILRENGVRVDTYCESSIPGIFAAGDVASWPYHSAGMERDEWVRLEHWDNALRQGEVAARNLLGRQVAYAHVPYFWSDQYDVKLQYVGHTTIWDRIVLRGDPDTHTFVAFYLADGRVRAALAVNRVRDLVSLKKLVGTASDPDVLADESTDLKLLVKRMAAI